MRAYSFERYLRLGSCISRITHFILLILLVSFTSTVADADKPVKYKVTATASSNGTISPLSKTVNSGSK